MIPISRGGEWELTDGSGVAQQGGEVGGFTLDGENGGGPPSPPRNLLSNLNDTSLMLEWSPPSDTGGRRDLTYNVQCKRCGPEPDQCQLCEEVLRFLPRPLGLVNASVTVMDFSAHANYTFEIESLNGVSDMSSFPRQVAIITVVTDQGALSQHLTMV
ncbi:unnamed protein product [Pleuronectes platessa]|uniref:Fibronectin type-III domain-containing protein n=1 Tax=Pleuronectes platessa TaxID=8262 RepID=A0A9N7UF72_PLEPL|nr:unnamed protein product [Pleuronectes platessa]